VVCEGRSKRLTNNKKCNLPQLQHFLGEQLKSTKTMETSRLQSSFEHHEEKNDINVVELSREDYMRKLFQELNMGITYDDLLSYHRSHPEFINDPDIEDC
jgi:hypothetical protein